MLAANCFISFGFVSEAFTLGALLDLEKELPDDLMGASTNSAQNGPGDSHITSQLSQDTSQKHQQLTHLLKASANPTPPQPGGNNSTSSPQGQGSGPPSRSPSVGISTSVANAVKSPLSNSLSSPPHGVLNKSGTPTSHINNDATVPNNSAAYTVANSSGSPALGTLANMNANMGINVKAMASQNMLNSAVGINQQQHLSHLINGPHHNMGGPGQGRGATGNLLGNSLNSNQQGNPSQNMGPPSMNANQANQPMMKVSQCIRDQFSVLNCMPSTSSEQGLGVDIREHCCW